MLTTPRINILFSSLFVASVLCSTLVVEIRGQVRSKTNMKKTELVEAAAVLKALAEDWDLVDNAPEIDFLIFVSEDREELDFYPKKSFVAMMERSGLIENPDNGSSVHDTYTYYERDDSVWREVTESGPIVFQYKITPKGRKLLRDAPKLIGKPIRELRVATSPVETQSKPLKVVTYDRPAI